MTVANVNVTKVLLKRGNTVQNNNYTGVNGEVTIDTQLATLRIHDGSTVGGTVITAGGVVGAYSNTNAAAYLALQGITSANIGGSQTFANANAAVQATAINSLDANIGAFQSYANITLSTIANAASQESAINSINANVGAYQTFANANALSQTTEINSLRANITAANSAITSLQSNAAVQAALLDTLTGNAATQSQVLDTLTSNAATQADALTTLLSNAVAQQTSLIDLVANAATQAQFISNTNANTKSYLAAFDGNIIPAANVTYSLGSEQFQWRDLWVSNATIYMNSVPISLTAGNVLTVNGTDVVTTSNGVSNIGNLLIQGTSISIAPGAPNTGIEISPNGESWAYLQLPHDATANASDTRLHNDAGNIEFGTGQFSTGGPNYTWTLNNNGTMTFPGTPRINTDANNFEVQAAESINFEANSVVNIYTDSSNNTYQWQFGDDGALTLPNDGVLAVDGNNLEVRGVDNFNVEVNGVVNIYTDTSGTTKQWQFGDSGDLSVPGDVQFADGSIITDNLEATGNFGISTAVNVGFMIDTNEAAHTWTFGDDGRLTFPGTPRIATDSDNFEVQAAESINFEANAVVNIYTDTSGTTYQWQFGDDGNLTAPGNVIFADNYVYRGNTFTSPETNGILKNFKWEFSDLSYGADTVTLQWNLLDTTFPQWYLTTNSQGNIYVFDGDAKTIGFLDNSINSGTVTFGTAVNNGAGGTNDIELTTVTGNAYVRTGSNSWKFDVNGNLIIPGNINYANRVSILSGLGGAVTGNISVDTSAIQFVASSSGDGNGYSTIRMIPDTNLEGTDQYLIIDPTAPGHIHIRAGGTQDNSSADLILGGEESHVRVTAGSNPPVYIRANSASWMFGVDSSLSMPTGGNLYFDSSATSVIDGITSVILADPGYIRHANLTSEIILSENTFRFESNVGTGSSYIEGQQNDLFLMGNLTTVISAMAGSSTWEFTANGNINLATAGNNPDRGIVFGDGSFQSTAWTGFGNTITTSNINVTSNLTSKNLTVTGNIAQQSAYYETYANVTNSGGNLTCNFVNGATFYATLGANVTANFTNVVVTTGTAVGVTLIVDQGVTPYGVSNIQINGGAVQSIRWAGGIGPNTGTASNTDIMSFSLINLDGTAWRILGQISNYA